MGHRRNLNNLRPADRQALANLMMSYLTDAVVDEHPALDHFDVHIFTHHRRYIEKMELWLSANGGARFVPLPYWDSATPIPPEFNVVKQSPGRNRPPLQNLNPNRPKPTRLAPPNVCAYANGDALGRGVDQPDAWHGSLHGAVGGTMSDFAQASAAPIFWPWHAFVDEIYTDWLNCRWGSWNNLGGGITAGPAAASWAPDRLDIFVKGTNNALFHRSWNGAWSSFVSLGGVIDDTPAAVSRAVNRIDVFARGMDNAVWTRSWNGAAWTGWTSLGGVITAGPAVASWAADRMDLFAKGTNNALYHKFWNGTTWSGWGNLGGIIDGSPAAVSWGPNRIDVVVRGMNNHVYHKFWNGTTWSGYVDLGGIVTAGPAIASWRPNRVDVFAKGTNNAVHWKWRDLNEGSMGGAWSGWHSLGGVIDSEPAAVSWGPNRIDVFARGMNNNLHQKVGVFA